MKFQIIWKFKFQSVENLSYFILYRSQCLCIWIYYLQHKNTSLSKSYQKVYKFPQLLLSFIIFHHFSSNLTWQKANEPSVLISTWVMWSGRWSNLFSFISSHPYSSPSVSSQYGLKSTIRNPRFIWNFYLIVINFTKTIH